MRWPSEDDLRRRLERDRVPRLLLLDDGTEPPDPVDCLEDWLRLPVSDDEVHARTEAVRRRSELHGNGVPALDDQGVLRNGDRWVALPPVEARITAALLDRIGGVVGRDALARAGWPEGDPGRNAIDVHMLRLRRRLAAVGLVIRTVRSRGYLLEAARPGDL